MNGRGRPEGMSAFTIIWLGQVASVLGTRMTNFALAIFVWQQTHRATDVGLMTFFAFGATVLCSPLAGALIDRWNRRLTIVLSDLGSAAAVLVALALFATHSVSVWHLFALNAVTGAFVAFQQPAYAATISLMMPREHFPRANAMLSMVRSIPGVFAPALAAALLGFVSVQGVLALDVASYAIGIGTVFLVAVPAAAPAARARAAAGWRGALVGFQRIWGDAGLRGLQAMLFAINLMAGLGWIVLTPMILARTGGDQVQLGAVMSIGAIGGIAGGLAVTATKAPAVKMPWVLLGILVFSVLGRVLLGLGDTLAVWAAAWFCAWACIPLIDGYCQSIWQERVEPAIQGRVFAARQLVENMTQPLSLAIAGPLADAVLEPAMRPGGALARALGGLVHPGPGGGMALIFVVSGLAGVAVTAVSALTPAVRRVESITPHPPDPAPAPAEAAGGGIR